MHVFISHAKKKKKTMFCSLLELETNFDQSKILVDRKAREFRLIGSNGLLISVCTLWWIQGGSRGFSPPPRPNRQKIEFF